MGKVVVKQGAARGKSAAPATPAPVASGTERALGLLRAIAERGGESSLTDLAAAQGLTGSVAYKLLQLLVAQGLVENDPDRKTYRAGLGLFNLATAILHGTSFVDIARANMRELVGRTGESACLNLLDAQRESFTVAAVEECGAPLQYMLRIGQLHPLHAGASGKSILAFQPPDVIRRVLSRKLDPVTSGTVVDSAALREQLEAIRRTGLCVSYGERLEGAVGIAAPILNHSAVAVGSVQLTVPRLRFDKAKLPSFSPAVIETAARISAAAQSLSTG